MRSDRTIVVVGLLLVLAAAAYEALVGLDIAEVGDPVDGAPGAAGLLLVAIAAVGLGGLVMFACGLVPAATERLTAVRELALVPVAAAMLLLYHHLLRRGLRPALDRFSNRDAAPTALGGGGGRGRSGRGRPARRPASPLGPAGGRRRIDGERGADPVHRRGSLRHPPYPGASAGQPPGAQQRHHLRGRDGPGRARGPRRPTG